MKYKSVGVDLIKKGNQICSRCIFDDSLSGISFNKKGICNYCEMVDSLAEEYGTGKREWKKKFEEIIEQIKKEGSNKKYDVIIGISGGTDSSYMLHIASEYNLRALAVHYDNTFNTATATENIRRITSALNIDLYTHVCDNKESEDIFRSFFLASVPEVDGATDIALAEVLFRASSKYGVKYVFEGHSFVTEGVAPMGKAYVDGGYIKDVHSQFGKIKMNTFPNMPFFKFMYWSIIKNIKKMRPLWYLEYSKEDAKILLAEEYGWQDYGGHHLENRMTAFKYSFILRSSLG